MGYSTWGFKESDTTEWLTLLLLLKQPYEVGINENPHFTNQEMEDEEVEGNCQALLSY